LIYRARRHGRESKNKMSALITSVEHALATAPSEANSSTIEAVTGLVSSQAANIERADSRSLAWQSTPSTPLELRLAQTA
jgi:hypothetical protein